MSRYTPDEEDGVHGGGTNALDMVNPWSSQPETVEQDLSGASALTKDRELTSSIEETGEMTPDIKETEEITSKNADVLASDWND